MRNAIDPKSVRTVILGKSCPKCTNAAVYGYHNAMPYNDGRQVIEVDRMRGRRELIEADWESYVREKLREGFVPNPDDPGTLIGRRELQRWMSSPCPDEVCDPALKDLRRLLDQYFGPYLLMLAVISIAGSFFLTK